MSKYTVTTNYTPNGPEYWVVDGEGKKRGMFDCPRWAEEYASAMNRKESEKAWEDDDDL